MTHELDPHEPRPEFIAGLEWQIRAALRHERVSIGRRVRMAAAVAAALIVGAAGGVASGQIQDAKQRDALLERARSEELLVRTRLALAQSDYDALRLKYEAGAAFRDSVIAAGEVLRDMESLMKRVRIDMAEIQATSATPRNDLQAPLVQGRDFVRERLALDLERAQQTLVETERALAELQKRVSVGLAQPDSLVEAERDLVTAKARLQKLAADQELRQRFLRGEVAAEDVVRAQRRSELTIAQHRAVRDIALAKEQVARSRKLVELGLVSELDAKRAEIRVLEAELELKRILTELAALKSGRE